MQLASLADVLILLVPGFLAYALLYRHLNPGRSESELVAGVKSILWSLPIDAVVDLIWRPGSHLSPGWVSGEVILTQLLLAVVAGLGLGYLQCRTDMLGRAWRRLGIFGRSTRPELFREAMDFRRHSGGYVEVRLRSGRRYEGALIYYTDDPTAELKELGLTDAYHCAPEASDFDRLPGPVYLRSDAVDAIVITHLSDGSDPDSHLDLAP